MLCSLSAQVTVSNEDAAAALGLGSVMESDLLPGSYEGTEL